MYARPIEVVVRCKNEMPWIERTLAALGRIDARVLFIDSGSTDGSLERAEAAGVDIVRIAPGDYVPGRVLNDAMRRTSGDVVAFVNADAIPLDDEAVARLVAACRAGAAAAYGRQVPRAAARDITRLDYARCFPATERPPFRHFFSMAASAIRRDVWQALSFDDDLRFSEDVDWTFRLRAIGRSVVYVPEAAFEHSHDYDVAGMRRRMKGEGVADAAIFRDGPPRPWKNLVRPLAAQLARDVVAGAPLLEAVPLRGVAQWARFAGLAEGAPRVARAARSAERFTLDGAPADERMVEALVERTASRVDAELGDRAVATLLLGSFACGEGAIEERDGVRRVHNDLDFVVLVRTRRDARALRAACSAIGAELSAATGATIDVWPASTDELATTRGRLLWIDAAVRGVRVVRGRREAIAALDALGARAVTSSEIGRLLANRATGLALSRLAFEADEDEGERAARHVAKAWTALGDALLLLVDRYAPTANARAANLEALRGIGAAFVGDVADGYARARRYRASPGGVRVDAGELARACAAMWPAFACLEAHRSGHPRCASPFDYADAKPAVFDDLADVRPIARALGGTTAALGGTIAWRRAARHPRDTLARVSVVLAFEADRARARGWARAALARASAAPDSLSGALERLREAAA